MTKKKKNDTRPLNGQGLGQSTPESSHRNQGNQRTHEEKPTRKQSATINSVTHQLDQT